MKVNDLYQEAITNELSKGDEEYYDLLRFWKSEDNYIYKEVNKMIDGLGLQEFYSDYQNDASIINENKFGNNDYIDQGLSHKIVSDAKKLDYDRIEFHERTKSYQPPILSSINKVEMPKLSKTQRRMSLDLMHLPSGMSNKLQSESNRPGLHKRKTSLSKPASTSTSNINVLTKPQNITQKSQDDKGVVNNQINPEPGVVIIKNRFKNLKKVLERFLFSLGKKDRQHKSTNGRVISPNAIDLNKKLMKDEEVQHTSATLSKAEQGHTQNQLTNRPRADPTLGTIAKKERRVSLVGENLPMYIRKQLDLDEEPHTHDDNVKKVLRPLSPISTEQSTVFSPSPKHDSVSTKSISRKQSRLDNILSNSQSLYTHSKDRASVKSGVSPNNTSNTTPYANDTTSDTDKEYILPNLFTKYYGGELEGDENEDNDALTDGIEYMEDDVDFINVGGSFEGFGVLGEDIDQEHEDDDEDDEDEDEEVENEYLFTT